MMTLEEMKLDKEKRVKKHDLRRNRPLSEKQKKIRLEMEKLRAKMYEEMELFLKTKKEKVIPNFTNWVSKGRFTLPKARKEEISTNIKTITLVKTDDMSEEEIKFIELNLERLKKDPVITASPNIVLNKWLPKGSIYTR